MSCSRDVEDRGLGRTQPHINGSRIAVLTLNIVPERNDTFKYERLGPLAVENHRQYCQRHGYAFIHDATVASDRPACWAKIPAILDALERYEWVLWADSDSLVMDPSRRLEDFCNPRYDMVTQSPREHCAHFGIDYDTGLRLTPINTGVFLVKASAWSKEFLRRAYQQTDLVSQGEIWDGIGDQEALTRLLGENPVDLRRIQHVELLQCHPRFHRAGNLFVHLFGNHARHRIPLADCAQVIDRWEQAVARCEPLPVNDLARFHWCCIQNKLLDGPVERGDLDVFLYQLEDIGADP